ncbi:glycosyltransferase family 2 protein [Planctomonas psychrotolerans]|uniref:glycosyltransferase family 2 protein n=1 Tax=Planctomonas psychrotolerans TaxID=2528712 RepID=UPI0012389F6A|nr:glycosyltransferase family 2 protein [Planctomonas psychrotolerans]
MGGESASGGRPHAGIGDVTVGIVIVNYNTREATLACLKSIAATSEDLRVSVVVVDNASSDGSAPAFRESTSATVIDSGGNLGFARAVNLGARALDTDYVLLLNPDTLMLPGSLRALLGFALEHPEYGVYGGRTLAPDGSLDPHSCWGAPTLWSTFCFGTGLSTFFKDSAVFDPESLGTWQRDTVREVDIVTGCLLLMTREDFLTVGGMDERYFLYGEDAEFSMRCSARGYRPVLVPEAVIVHENGGSSTSSDGSKMSMVLAGKVTLFRTLWSPPRATIAVALLHAGVLLRALLERATRRGARPWAGVWAKRARWSPGYPKAEALLFGPRDSTPGA